MIRTKYSDIWRWMYIGQLIPHVTLQGNLDYSQVFTHMYPVGNLIIGLFISCIQEPHYVTCIYRRTCSHFNGQEHLPIIIVVTCAYKMCFFYCKTRTFSGDKFSLINPSKHFRSFNFHHWMTVLFYIITKVNILKAFNFHGFASSLKIVKINCRWNFLVLHYEICKW